MGDEVGNVLEAFLAQREQAVGVLLAAGGPRRGITFLHEAALAVGLRQEKAMGVVSKKRVGGGKEKRHGFSDSSSKNCAFPCVAYRL